MTSRVTLELDPNRRRGAYDVRIDGEWAGWVTAHTGTWVMTPLVLVPDGPRLDDDPRRGHRPNRHQAIVYGLTRSGIPESVGDSLMYGWALSPVTEVYVTTLLDTLRSA